MNKKFLKRFASGVLCGTLLAGTAFSNIDILNVKAQNVKFNEATIGTEIAKASSVYDLDKDTLPFTQQQIYSQLFDINNTISVSVDMTNDEIKKLQRDFERNSSSPIYRKANVSISITIPNDKTYTYNANEVGIRLKGNTTRKSLYSENDGILNLDHFKISFQETFDDVADGYNNGEYYIDSNGNSTWDEASRKARKKRVFGNMEKIDIKWNSNLDTTYLREYYSYEVFRSEGIAAPHIGLTTMQMNITDKSANSAYLGVYTIHEPVDSKFIKNNLLDTSNNYIINSNGDYTDGDLYKSGWANPNGNWIGANLTTGCSYGVADDLKGISYNYDLKTNKKKSTKAPIKDLLNGLSNVSSKEDLAKFVDMDYFVKFAAVSYVLGNGDDMRNNYNNYYLYFYADNTNSSNPVQKAIIIPYDYDRCFGITNGMNSDNTAMTGVDPFSKNATAQGDQQNPLYRYSVCKGGYYIDEYTAALKEVMNNPLLSVDEFEKYYNVAKKNYADKTTPSKDFDNKINSDSSTKVTKESFYFTMDTTNDIKNINTSSVSRNDQNLLISLYLDKMLNTLGKAVGSSSELNVADCYMRGEFSDWSVRDDYKLSYNKASGLHSFKLVLNETKNFKIYNSVSDAWYGYDNIVDKNVQGISAGADSGNIKAEAGTYYIIYDATKNTIQISTTEIETTTKEQPTTTQKPTTTEPTTKEEATTEPITEPVTEKPTETASAIETTTENEVVVAFGITLNANGGKIGNSSTYKKEVVVGKTYGTLKNPTRKKYTFDGWYTNKSGGRKITSSTKVVYNKDETVLYAHWKKVSVGKVSVSSVKNAKSKQLTVTLKKVNGAKGYEILCSTSNKFKSSKKITSTSLKKNITSLNKGKTYYVKARAYKNDSTNSKIYGSYSAIKKVKIKK